MHSNTERQLRWHKNAPVQTLLLFPQPYHSKKMDAPLDGFNIPFLHLKLRTQNPYETWRTKGFLFGEQKSIIAGKYSLSELNICWM